MSELNLHELINAPFAGTAQKAVIEAGMWDELAGVDTRKFSVRIEYEYSYSAKEVVSVSARDEDEAIELAERKFSNENAFDHYIVSSEVVDE